MRHVSTGTMVKQISGLHGTRGVTRWENDFIENVVEQTRDGADTTRLTETQVASIEQIWQQHFA